MTHFASGNAPGFQVAATAAESEVTWSGRKGQDLVATRKVTIDAAATDGGNTPSTTLRGGLVLAKEDATGKFKPYSPDANDGLQIAVGILEKGQSMLVDGVATDRFTHMLVHGLVREGELRNFDDQARQQLGSRFTFDREASPQAGTLMHPRGAYRKDADYTVLASDSGLLFLATAAVTFTLPNKAVGLAFRFAQTADANLVITGSSDIVHKGNAAASSVAFSTASQRTGSQALVECVYVAPSTLKWLVTNLGGTNATVT